MYSKNSSEGFKEVPETIGMKNVSLEGVHPFLRNTCSSINIIIDRRL